MLIHYEITTKEDIGEVSRGIALEQTVELPYGLVRGTEIEKNIVGRVKEIRPVDDSSDIFDVIIEYNINITGYIIPQFLNVLFGNISIKNNIRITAIDLPAQFLDRFEGPGYGIEGIREVTGVYGRPLLSTALKPMGALPKRLAEMAGLLALGGVDIIKDDHGLIDHAFCPFKERVIACRDAVDKANMKTGRNTLYFPNVLADMENLEEQIRFCVREGIRGVLLAPFLLGLDTVRYISEKYRLIIMLHPALSGTNFSTPAHGIAPHLLLGTIFRLIGGDASVYPNHGGRFNLSVKECLDICKYLKRPLGGLRPAFAAPAGGMGLKDIPEMSRLYGSDAIFLIGGALLGHSTDLAENAGIYLDAIKENFKTSIYIPPQGQAQSSCELPSLSPVQSIETFLRFRDDFRWEGRRVTEYKDSGQTGFKGILRQELTGTFGEETGFDLRYFEIEPDGYSSLERHLHEHVIICIRGGGELTIDKEIIRLSPFDIAYIPPMSPHQLRNTGSLAFGFFCIVDHLRDKPIPLV